MGRTFLKSFLFQSDRPWVTCAGKPQIVVSWTRDGGGSGDVRKDMACESASVRQGASSAFGFRQQASSMFVGSPSVVVGGGHQSPRSPVKTVPDVIVGPAASLNEQTATQTTVANKKLQFLGASK